jgi:hypothetical protein
MAEIVVERGTKDQRVFPALRAIDCCRASSRFNHERIARRAGRCVTATAIGTFDGTNLAFWPDAEVTIRSSEPAGILPWGTRSFSTYLFFINTKTR